MIVRLQCGLLETLRAKQRWKRVKELGVHTAVAVITSQTLTAVRDARETSVTVVLTGTSRSYLIHLSGIDWPSIVVGVPTASEFADAMHCITRRVVIEKRMLG